MRELMMNEQRIGSLKRIALQEIGENLAHLRIVRPFVEEQVRRSLEKHGQLSPVTLWRQPETGSYELVDGFKRLRAARKVARLHQLSAHCVEGTGIEMTTKVLTLNRPGAGLSAMEEGWIAQYLMRNHQMSQMEIAAQLGRHQTWVSRRLGLVEKLVPGVQEEVRLGLLAPTIAGTLATMQRCIQEPFVKAIHQEGLSSRQVNEMAAILEKASPEQQEQLLQNVREVLQNRARTSEDPPRDPRLSPLAGELNRQIGMLLGLSHRFAMKLGHVDFSQMGSIERSVLMQSLEALYHQTRHLMSEIQQKIVPGSGAPVASNQPTSSAAGPNSRTSSSISTEPGVH